MSIDRTRITSIVESLIFVSDRPLSFRKIRSILDGVPGKDLQEIIQQLTVDYREAGRGILIEEVAEGFQMRTPPENQEWVKMLIEYKPMRLSRAALETLAIIAYRQPATKTDVEAIRGVDSTSAVAKLLELGLIKILGRKEIPGRPFVYGTTPEFLETFNLASLGDLPSLKEIEDLNPSEIEAFTEKLSESAGEKIEPASDAEAESDSPTELESLEQATDPEAPDDETAVPTNETQEILTDDLEEDLEKSVEADFDADSEDETLDEDEYAGEEEIDGKTTDKSDERDDLEEDEPLEDDEDKK